ncbi:MAG TPA: rhomboid family intramembrane serine protease [Armatimonadota bacterium]|nr:rhomboid family intramembrane serine protease [Armatimonadota bacterium]
MIPIRDENPTRTTPYVVYVLIALNVLFFIIDSIGAQDFRGNLWGYSMIPAEIVTGEDLPAVIRGEIVPHSSPNPVWLTIITSMFLHGGWLHLGGNMLYLWIFGNNIEDALGHVKFLFFYLMGGVVAACAHILFNINSQVPTVGASGAIAAVLGAYLVLFPKHRVIVLVFLLFFITTIAVPAVVVLGIWFALQVFSAIEGTGMTPGSGGVAYWAHIGGFVAGVVGILLFGGRRLVRNYPSYRRYEPRNRRSWYED